MKRPGYLARDRTNPMRVVVNDSEREAIKARAKAASLTVSAFFRAAALGSVRAGSALDLQAVATLAKVNADQGRLGGLLKMYLQDPAPDRRVAERLLAEIQEIQTELKAIVRTVQT